MADAKVNLINYAGNEITWREGKAVEPLPLKEPKIINISGDIKSVSTFLSGRTAGHSSQEVDKNKALVTVDKTERTIVLQLDPENHYGATITGTLEESDELSEFGINTQTVYDRKKLLDLIRFNRIFFEDKNEYQRVVDGLYKVRFRSETEMSQAKDNSGNKSAAIDVKTAAHEGFVKDFTLTIPIFKGYPAEKITVEICYEVINNSIAYWLESIGLKEATDGQVEGIFAEQLKSCEGFVIINK